MDTIFAFPVIFYSIWDWLESDLYLLHIEKFFLRGDYMACFRAVFLCKLGCISQKVNKFSMFQQLKYTDREEENICMVYAYLYLCLEVGNLSLRLPAKNKYRKLPMNLFYGGT